MPLLPVALNVENKRCLVVGGGTVAERKTRALLECGALVTIVSPALTQGLHELKARIEWRAQAYSSGALHECSCDGFALVFACTNRREINAQVARDAGENNVWCNIADDSQNSDFHTAATVRRGAICIAITSGGGSPALSRHLKTRVETAIGDEYAALLEMMSTRRLDLQQGETQGGETQGKRAELWRALLRSDALDLLRSDNREQAEALVDGLVARWKHNEKCSE